LERLGGIPPSYSCIKGDKSIHFNILNNVQYLLIDSLFTSVD
jgi:hypothetical protein